MRHVIAALVLLTGAVSSADPECTNPVWVTVDDFILPGTSDSAATAVWVDGSTTWVAGTATDPLTGHWVVRKSDSSGPFSTIDDFIYSVGLRNVPSGVVRTGGTLFVYGGANNASENGHWLVRGSSNNGATWSTVDDFNPYSASHATAMTVDSSGALLVGGHTDPPDGYHWFTRRSTDLGGTWSTVDDYAPIKDSTGPRSMDLDKSHAVFSSGYAWNGSQYRWQTRRQSAPGGSWTLVDDWTPITDAFAYAHNSYGAQPASVAAGQNPGLVLVVGTVIENDAAIHWVVRRTTDGGNTWQIVDDLANCSGRGISFDRKDQKGFYTVGRCIVGGSYRWIVRRSDPQGSTWTTEDNYALDASASSTPNSIFYSKSGGVYAVGNGSDGLHSHWIVRNRECQLSALHLAAPRYLIRLPARR